MEAILVTIWLVVWLMVTVAAAWIGGEGDSMPPFFWPLFFGWAWPLFVGFMLIIGPLIWIAKRGDRANEDAAK